MKWVIESMSTIAAHVQYMIMCSEALGWFALLDRVESREEEKEGEMREE